MQPVRDHEADLAALAADRGMTALLRHWWQARLGNDGAVPVRAQMDPCDLPRSILPLMFIYERVGDRLRCRLSGTRMRDLFGIDGTGLFLDQMIAPQSVPDRNALFHRTLDSGLPLLYRGFLVPVGKGWREFNRLLLPVAVRAGEPAAQVMGMVRVFDPPPGAAAMEGADANGLLSAQLLAEDEYRTITGCGEATAKGRQGER